MTEKTDPSLTPDNWNELARYVNEQFDFKLFGDAIGQLDRFTSELTEWNKIHNLVSYRSQAELLWRHIADSLAALKFIGSKKASAIKVADIGTGAGLPGIPVKIALPLIDLMLVESITKKCAFIDHVRSKLNMAHSSIVNDRVENIAQDKKYRESFDVVLSRAVCKLSPNLELALPLLKVGGIALIYKTDTSAFGDGGIDSSEKALDLLGGEFVDHFCYELPGQQQTYCLLAIEKIKPTPNSYPRKPGIPEKKPL